jgi:hypothetical protein
VTTFFRYIINSLRAFLKRWSRVVTVVTPKAPLFLRQIFYAQTPAYIYICITQFFLASPISMTTMTTTSVYGRKAALTH